MQYIELLFNTYFTREVLLKPNKKTAWNSSQTVFLLFINIP